MELTLRVFPRDPAPGMAVLRFHFRRRVSARTHVRSICMRPARAEGCRAGNKRDCCLPGSTGYNSSPIPETKEEKSGFSRPLQQLHSLFALGCRCRFNTPTVYHAFLSSGSRRSNTRPAERHRQINTDGDSFIPRTLAPF